MLSLYDWVSMCEVGPCAWSDKSRLQLFSAYIIIRQAHSTGFLLEDDPAAEGRGHEIVPLSLCSTEEADVLWWRYRRSGFLALMNNDIL